MQTYICTYMLIRRNDELHVCVYMYIYIYIYIYIQTHTKKQTLAKNKRLIKEHEVQMADAKDLVRESGEKVDLAVKVRAHTRVCVCHIC